MYASRTRIHLLRRTAGLLLMAALTLPAAASADSIVYVDGGNIWSATPDGTRKVQLTDGGNWHSPTQADDGTVAAVQGTGPIQVMTGNGRPLHTITTAQAPTANGGTFAARPIQLSFSPDGTKIAYAYAGRSCPVASTCDPGQTSTFYTAANVTQATPQSVYGNQYGVSNPEWITNDRTLVFGGAGSQVSIDPLGGGDYSFTPWIVPNADLGDGELSRDGRRLVTTFGYGEDLQLVFWSVRGDAKTELPPRWPAVACDTKERDAAHADPTWSPDSTSLAYASSKGIQVFRFTELAPDRCAANDATLLTATGTSPDWGPADAPTARWTPAEQQTPNDVAGGGSSGNTGTTGGTSSSPGDASRPASSGTTTDGADAPAARITSRTTVSLAALRAGLKVAITTTSPGQVTIEIRRRGKTIVKRTISVKTAGNATVRMPKLSTTKARKLRGAGTTIEITAGEGKGTSRLTVR